MKAIIISPKQQKTELIWIAACICAAFLMNVFAIFLYQTSWSEIYTQLLWVLIITCVLYAVSTGLRIAFYLIKRIFRANDAD